MSDEVVYTIIKKFIVTRQKQDFLTNVKVVSVTKDKNGRLGP